MIQLSVNRMSGDLVVQFSENQILTWIDRELGQVKKTQKPIKHCPDGVKVRELKSLLESSLQKPDESINERISSLFQQGALFSNYLYQFDSIYCNRCQRFVDREQTSQQVHVIPKPARHNRGGASFTYLVCDNDHRLFELSRRVS